MSRIKNTYVSVTDEELAEARRYSMTIEWSDDDGAFVVSFPDAPGVMTHGATREEAATMGDDAIVTWYTALKDAGRPIPPPTLTAREAEVALPDLAEAGEIRRIRAELNVSQRVFAELLNVHVSTVRSWEQGWRVPDGASLRLLTIAKRYPRVLLEALHSKSAS